MVANAIFATAMILLALGLFLLGECRFLIPYRDLLLGQYAKPIALYAACMFVNLFAVIFAINRRLFLKDTGRKLAHVGKQLHSGSPIAAELSERLRE